MYGDTIIVRLANERDQCFIQNIITEINDASKINGTGICKREHALISQKIKEGNAVIAITDKNQWVGFCYIQEHENGKFVSSCALVIAPSFRNNHVATRIKERILDLAKEKYPAAVIFGFTTSRAVMKINEQLGYEEVSYADVTQAASFWQSCETCENYQFLLQNSRQTCLCKAMVHLQIISSAKDPKALAGLA